jgi:predicted PhzF superfamily epimerase YddE/YHI9
MAELDYWVVDVFAGATAGCAIGYLVKHGVVTPGRRVHLRQGVEVGGERSVSGGGAGGREWSGR